MYKLSNQNNFYIKCLKSTYIFATLTGIRQNEDMDFSPKKKTPKREYISHKPHKA